ncbi:hypothetical protein M9458_052336 [Cirrhinus mrigala]|uniref:ribonuclease H n=1 Tax=Cirrhinus mrigala TaxID=683832 RepID=A0ABD0MX08_CIRMR
MAFVDGSCPHCERMSMAALRLRLSCSRRLPSVPPRCSSSGSKCSAATLVRKKGNLAITVRNAPTGQPPGRSNSSRGPVPRGEPSVYFGAPEEDRMSIAASEEGLTPDEAEESAEQLLSRRPMVKLVAMLLRAAKSIGPDVRKAPSPEPSRLDDWFLGSRRDSNQQRPAPVPFFPEVHEELTKTCKAPYSARTRSGSSLLTTFDDGAARGYADIRQVERAVAVQLCPQNAATWRNRARLPSKACKLSPALTAKAYSAAGQAASAPDAMAILQVHQAQALKQLHEGRPDEGSMQELRTATDFALRATKVTAWSLGQVMSTTVVQERHLWLNLAQVADADKVCFLNAPVSQVGLFGDTVEDFAQQFSAVQKQTETIKHILPRRESIKPPAPKPSSARRRGRPPAASTSAPPLPPPKETPAPQRGRRAGRGRGTQPAAQASTPRNSRSTTHSQKEQFSVSLGLFPRLRVLSDAPLPQTQARSIPLPPPRDQGQRVSAASRSSTLLRGRCASYVESPSSPWLPQRRYVTRSVDPSSTQVGGVAIASQPVTLVDPDDTSVLCAEIAVLLAKDTIEPVPPAEMKSGFYSPYFIIPKKTGGLRPILDLRVLNRSLHRLPFKISTSKRIISCLRLQDRFAAIDLKDAYFHVSILPRHRPFLRFAFEGRVFQYKVLPFGLALSPVVFTKLAEGALAPPWELGIRILNYLDDWLIIAHSRDLLCAHRDRVLRHLSLLGLQVNWEKSKLSPVQSISFLGRELDSVSMMGRLTEERAKSVLNCLSLFRHKTAVPLKVFQRLLGHMASYETASALAPWPDPEMRMAPQHVSGRRYPGMSPPFQPVWHINCLELLAVFHALRRFRLMLRGKRASPDGQHRDGRLHQSPGWLMLPPRDRNRAAAALSRQLTLPGEWRLHPQVVQLIWSRFGEAQVDLFASPESAHCQLFYSLTEAPLGTDALAHSWPRGLIKYAFPPVSLLAQGGRGAGLVGCAVLAQPDLVRRTHVLRDSPSLEDSPGEGPSFSGDGHHLAPPADLSGLPQAVIDTITQARAPSTRQAYALKWGLFVDWCSSR